MGNFVAEVLTLAGTFKVSIMFASLASLGLIASAIYSLRIVRKIFFEKKSTDYSIKDLSARESFILGAMVIAIFFTGLYPRPVIYTVKPVFEKTLRIDKQSMFDGEEGPEKAVMPKREVNDRAIMDLKK